MKPALLLLAASAALAQNISVGIRAGVPMTDAFDATVSAARGFDDIPKRYTFGPTIEVRLPMRLGVTFDILYKRLSYRQVEIDGLTFTHTSSRFEFPLMLRYRFGEGNLRPFVAGGPTFDKVNAGSVRDPVRFVKSSTAGIVLGAGVEVQALLIRITPELRYTHRGAEHFVDAVGGLLKSNRQQAEFLVGVTF